MGVSMDEIEDKRKKILVISLRNILPNKMSAIEASAVLESYQFFLTTPIELTKIPCFVFRWCRNEAVKMFRANIGKRTLAQEVIQQDERGVLLFYTPLSDVLALQAF
jgi:hypothetical protein